MTVLYRLACQAAFALSVLFIAVVTVRAESNQAAVVNATLLNVSYDVARELYKDINPAFAGAYKAKSGEAVTVNQSHGGSSKQAMSVAGGLEADVITMNQPTDVDFLAEKGGFVTKDWRQRFPFEASPYTATIIFLVRKGNPKSIKDWADLAKAGIQVIVPNPKTSGNGRYTYLAAWGYGLEKSGNEAGAREFTAGLFKNVPVLDGGGRGATTTFTQRSVGDVLVTFENEAVLLGKEIGGDQFEIVYPSLSIEATAPVAIVDPVVEKRGPAKWRRPISFLFSPEGQAIIAKHNFRPRDAAVLTANASRFPAVRTFTVEGLLGGWSEAQTKHFADGGIYDQIIVRR